MDMDKMQAELVRDEGEVLHVYQDNSPEKLWTIGVGQLVDPRRGGKISQAASRFMLAESIREKAAELDKAIPWWRDLTDARQRVLLNMAFNLGVLGLLGFHLTLQAVERGAYDAAADAMLASRWARQVGDRAERLAEMMRKGE